MALCGSHGKWMLIWSLVPRSWKALYKIWFIVLDQFSWNSFYIYWIGHLSLQIVFSFQPLLVKLASRVAEDRHLIESQKITEEEKLDQVYSFSKVVTEYFFEIFISLFDIINMIFYNYCSDCYEVFIFWAISDCKVQLLILDIALATIYAS